MSAQDRIDELLSRWSAPDAGGSSQSTLLARLSQDRRDEVVRRLPILDDFMRAQEEGRADAEATASALGLTKRSLYRLVRRVREMGAVQALAPTSGAGRKRRSDADTSLSDAAVDELRRQVQDNPNQPVTALLARIRKVDPGAPASTVRKRALALRRELEPSKDRPFGRSWLMDQAALRLQVDTPEGTAWLVATFLVEVDAGAIMGFCVTVEGEDGCAGALLSGLERLPALLGSSLTIASRVRELTWAVHDDVLSQADEIARIAAESRSPINTTFVTAGKFRRGVGLVKVLGGAVGPLQIMVRATPDPWIDDESYKSRPMDPDRAELVLDRVISEANERFAGRAWQAAKKRAPSKVQYASLQRIMADLLKLFEPLLSDYDLEYAKDLVAEMQER